jgi:hypothetical protein
MPLWLSEFCSEAEAIRPSFSLIRRSFSAQLVGDSTIIKPKEWRVVAVSFTPRQGGLCEAVLDLTFHDHKRKADFVIKRTLTGWANRPPGARGHHQKKSTPNPGCQSINDGVNDHHTEILVDEEEDFLDSDGTGISVSHEGGLYFGIVERKRSNGPFATPSSLLAIELAAGFPGVTFMKKKTRMLNGSDPECVLSLPHSCLYSSLPQVRSSFRGRFKYPVWDTKCGTGHIQPQIRRGVRSNARVGFLSQPAIGFVCCPKNVARYCRLP